MEHRDRVLTPLRLLDASTRVLAGILLLTVFALVGDEGPAPVFGVIYMLSLGAVGIAVGVSVFRWLRRRSPAEDAYVRGSHAGFESAWFTIIATLTGGASAWALGHLSILMAKELYDVLYDLVWRAAG